jgi:hypothetical protein
MRQAPECEIYEKFIWHCKITNMTWPSFLKMDKPLKPKPKDVELVSCDNGDFELWLVYTTTACLINVMQNKLFAEFDTPNREILVQLHSGRDHNKCLSPRCHDYMYSQEVAMWSMLYSMITIVVPTSDGQILETTLPPKWGQLLLGFTIIVLKN